MAIRFPQRRVDGSFDVIVRLGGVRDGEALVRRWISEWGQQNSSWTRNWEGLQQKVEVLHMLDDFFSPPSYELQHKGEIAARFRVRPEAKVWKDWMAKFVEDFQSAHPESVLLRVDSEPESR